MKKHKLGFACLFTLLAYSLVIVYIHDHSDNVLAWQMITYCSIFGPFLAIIALFGLLSLRKQLKEFKRIYEIDRGVFNDTLACLCSNADKQQCSKPTT